ncbi:alkene reductase [Flammeovirgaceae bacterium SG7u.111]|nr:alkene reductase [Flammeovirgaceae bacterium SG7u.132]WPO33542.1 alkene reductase [Flammeovirgaceae bacterium SG7u.111]
MQDSILFKEAKLGNVTLKNKVVMAPMTRSRAIDNAPNDLMATYYRQRSEAGLIITEGASPSVNGLGYSRIPGIFTTEQVEGWKKVTSAVHENNSRIFIQLMHTGRVGHVLNLPEGAEVVAPTAEVAPGEMYTDQEGLKEHTQPRLMNTDDIAQAKQEFVDAAKNTVEAGFDGIELHAANGYLLEQFINPGTNQLTNEYGGSVENRLRFVLEVAQASADAIGADKVGIRVSPYGVFNGVTPVYDELEEAYTTLAAELGKIGLAYIHIVDHSAMGAPEVPVAIKEKIRDAFGGTFIISGGYDKQKAEADLEEGLGHLVAFGRSFISNPDLVSRMKAGAELQAPDMDTFYTPGEKGYTDYSALEQAKA